MDAKRVSLRKPDGAGEGGFSANHAGHSFLFVHGMYMHTCGARKGVQGAGLGGVLLHNLKMRSGCCLLGCLGDGWWLQWRKCGALGDHRLHQYVEDAIFVKKLATYKAKKWCASDEDPYAEQGTCVGVLDLARSHA